MKRGRNHANGRKVIYPTTVPADAQSDGLPVHHLTAYGGAIGFQHETDATGGPLHLRHVPTPEGRLVFAPEIAGKNAGQNWQYEYHFKDQVGNLRLAFRTLGRVRQDVEVGFEPDSIIAQRGTGAPTPHLTRVAETRYRAPLMARTGEHVALLNARTGRRLGPALTLPV